MSDQRFAAKFRFIDLTLIVAVVGVLLMLASCGIGHLRPNLRRNQCQSTIRMIGIALYGMGSSPTGYPQASTAAHVEGEKEIGLPLVGAVTVDGQTYSAPGAADPTSGGYSWLVMILDSLEEVSLYSDIQRSSDNYREPAFGEDMVRNPGGGGASTHFCQQLLPFLKCTAFTGEFYADPKGEIYSGSYSQPGISNYVCVPGTHFKSKDGLVENGVIVSRREMDRFGVRAFTQDNIGDGTTKTLTVCETREPNYASWYDGQVNWVTPFAPKYNGDLESEENRVDEDPCEGVPDAVNKWTTAINAGPCKAGETEEIFMSQHPYDKDQSYGGRQWGPSSMHGGGVVFHAFADGHTAIITEEIDPAIYFAFVTRNGCDFYNPEPITRE